jgi:hypothetical protein
MEETTEVEITNPTNSAQKAKILASYRIVYHPGRSHMSNGDIGYPEDYEEVFDTWEYIGDEDCPDWLTSTLVKKYCEI